MANDLKVRALDYYSEQKKRIDDFIVEAVDTIKVVNAKLYDVVVDASYNESTWSDFDNFCEDNWRWFKEEMDDNLLELTFTGGSNSSFVITQHLLNGFYKEELLESYYTQDVVWAGYLELMGKTDVPTVYEYETFDDYIESQLEYCDNVEEVYKEVLNDMEFFDKHWWYVLEDNLQNVNIAYNRLEEFKTNQVKLWKEYIYEVA